MMNTQRRTLIAAALAGFALSFTSGASAVMTVIDPSAIAKLVDGLKVANDALTVANSTMRAATMVQQAVRDPRSIANLASPALVAGLDQNSSAVKFAEAVRSAGLASKQLDLVKSQMTTIKEGTFKGDSFSARAWGSIVENLANQASFSTGVYQTAKERSPSIDLLMKQAGMQPDSQSSAALSNFLAAQNLESQNLRIQIDALREVQRIQLDATLRKAWESHFQSADAGIPTVRWSDALPRRSP